MTNTIEVPISLIKAGDMDAIRELLPKPDLFGRWATHPDYGRVIVISAHPDQFNAVRLARSEKIDTNGKAWQAQVYLDSLTLDPVELTTAEDFGDAPVEDVLRELQAKVDEFTRERDELQANVAELVNFGADTKLGLLAADAKVRELKAENEQLKASSHPALPEGMRIAEHPEYGRVVVSPGVDDDGDYKVFSVKESAICKADYGYADPSELTFLEADDTHQIELLTEEITND